MAPWGAPAQSRCIRIISLREHEIQMLAKKLAVVMAEKLAMVSVEKSAVVLVVMLAVVMAEKLAPALGLVSAMVLVVGKGRALVWSQEWCRQWCGYWCWAYAWYRWGKLLGTTVECNVPGWTPKLTASSSAHWQSSSPSSAKPDFRNDRTCRTKWTGYMKNVELKKESLAF